MIIDAIENFPEQLKYEPKIINADKLIKANRFIVAGMGGSHLSADLIKTFDPSLDLIVHSDYGLPKEVSPEELKQRLIIVSSYSGNTEEVIDAFKQAAKQGLNVAAVSVGGRLIELAKEYGVPYIQIPDTGIQPRSAIGFSAVALLKLMGKENALADIKKSSEYIANNMISLKEQGRELAGFILNFVPIIYASSANSAIANNWNMRFTGISNFQSLPHLFPFSRKIGLHLLCPCMQNNCCRIL